MSGLAGIARALHVLAIVIWIGGVAMITVVILPLIRSAENPERELRLLENVQARFSPVARAMMLIAGVTGFYMVWTFDLWPRFADPVFWWMDAMVLVWVVFTLILFVVEPLLHRRMSQAMQDAPQRAIRRMLLTHWLLLLASAIAILGAVAGAHGYSWF